MGESYLRPEPLRGKHELQAFSCGEASLDRWLLRYSRQAEATGSSRVFVTTCDGVQVVGFHALAAGAVAPEDATARLMKGQPETRPVPIILLTRLAVDLSHQGQGLGQSLLQDAMIKAEAAAATVGARALTVHAIDRRARLWYGRFGFEASPTDGHHMIVLMSGPTKAARRRLLELNSEPAALVFLVPLDHVAAPDRPWLVALALEVSVDPVAADLESAVVAEQLDVAVDDVAQQLATAALYELDVSADPRALVLAVPNHDAPVVLRLDVPSHADALGDEPGVRLDEHVVVDACADQLAGPPGGDDDIAVDRLRADLAGAPAIIGVGGRDREHRCGEGKGHCNDEALHEAKVDDRCARINRFDFNPAISNQTRKRVNRATRLHCCRLSVEEARKLARPWRGTSARSRTPASLPCTELSLPTRRPGESRFKLVGMCDDPAIPMQAAMTKSLPGYVLPSGSVFDCPDMTPIDCAEPIVAHERVVEFPGDDSGGWRLALTPAVELVSGGTAIMPRPGAIAAGDLPQPWNGPVTHADRRVGATRGTFPFFADRPVTVSSSLRAPDPGARSAAIESIES